MRNFLRPPLVLSVASKRDLGKASKAKWIMSFFEHLKTEASADWRAYTEHPFTNGLADGSLAEAVFRRAGQHAE